MNKDFTIDRRYLYLPELMREMGYELVKHGHWTNYKDEHTCSVCHATVCEEAMDGEWGSQGIYDYCPYCGAKMDE